VIDNLKTDKRVMFGLPELGDCDCQLADAKFTFCMAGGEQSVQVVFIDDDDGEPPLVGVETEGGVVLFEAEGLAALALWASEVAAAIHAYNGGGGEDVRT
jgi:hypothetical protein